VQRGDRRDSEEKIGGIATKGSKGWRRKDRRDGDEGIERIATKRSQRSNSRLASRALFLSLFVLEIAHFKYLK
jgi:hypothetical protein